MKQDVFLLPGEIYFGNCARRVKTVLGSCVAVVMWHPRLKLGGMCHFVMPEMPVDTPTELACRYSEGAIGRLFHEAMERDTVPERYWIGIYGGGYMQHAENQQGRYSVGSKNILAAQRLLRKYNVTVHEQRVGGPVYRSLMLDVESGSVELKESAFQRSVMESG